MQSQESASKLNVTQMVEQFIASRKISRRQYQQLYVAILADGQIDEEEQFQINRLWNAVKSGLLKITD